MKTNRLLLQLLLCGALLSTWSAAVAAPQGGHHAPVPEGFGYADAHLDSDGDGFILWKDVDSNRSRLQRYESFTQVEEWSFDRYLAKGFRWNGGKRILLQAVSPGSDDLRLYELRGDRLELTWDSAHLSEAMQLSPEHLHLSEDFRWWYGSRYLNDRIEVFAGALRDPNPSFRWIVDEPSPDAFLASLVEVAVGNSPTGQPIGKGPPSLALTVNGKAWLLSPRSLEASSLVLPAECLRIVSLEDGRDGLWAHCGHRVHVLYASFTADQESPGIQPSSVIRAPKLQVLPNGTAVVIDRRHGEDGTLTELGRDPSGEVRASGPPRTFPLPLGVAGHIAGDQLLLPVPPGASAPEVYQVVGLSRGGRSNS